MLHGIRKPWDDPTREERFCDAREAEQREADRIESRLNELADTVDESQFFFGDVQPIDSDDPEGQWKARISLYVDCDVEFRWVVLDKVPSELANRLRKSAAQMVKIADLIEEVE